MHEWCICALGRDDVCVEEHLDFHDIFEAKGADCCQQETHDEDVLDRSTI